MGKKSPFFLLSPLYLYKKNKTVELPTNNSWASPTLRLPKFWLLSSVYKIVTYYKSKQSFTRRAPLEHSEISSKLKPLR